MARLEDRLPQNAAGDFFVDSRCIDCDTCRALAPQVFARDEGFSQSYVRQQPGSDQDRQEALMALVACPTSAIGTTRRLDVRRAVDAFPAPVAEDVYYCGFAAESSFGAASYLIRRPRGNVLVDSPRATKPLLRRLEALGGVDLMFLTHRDDVADHAVFRRALGCERVLHAADVSAATADVERRLTGEAPVALADDLVAIPVPGHTPGSTSLLYRDEFLFSGDHLWWSAERGRLHASRCVNWYSWPEQVRSLRKLLDFRFRWVLPGHGRRFRAETHEQMHEALRRLVADLERRARR